MYYYGNINNPQTDASMACFCSLYILTVTLVVVFDTNLPVIQSGSTGYIEISANSYKDVQIEFPKPFESDPNILASIWGKSDSPSYGNINFSYIMTIHPYVYQYSGG